MEPAFSLNVLNVRLLLALCSEHRQETEQVRCRHQSVSVQISWAIIDCELTRSVVGVGRSIIVFSCIINATEYHCCRTRTIILGCVHIEFSKEWIRAARNWA